MGKHEDDAYREAVERIRQAAEDQAVTLDLGLAFLTELPSSLAGLTQLGCLGSNGTENGLKLSSFLNSPGISLLPSARTLSHDSSSIDQLNRLHIGHGVCWMRCESFMPIFALPYSDFRNKHAAVFQCPGDRFTPKTWKSMIEKPGGRRRT